MTAEEAKASSARQASLPITAELSMTINRTLKQIDGSRQSSPPALHRARPVTSVALCLFCFFATVVLSASIVRAGLARRGRLLIAYTTLLCEFPQSGTLGLQTPEHFSPRDDAVTRQIALYKPASDYAGGLLRRMKRDRPPFDSSASSTTPIKHAALRCFGVTDDLIDIVAQKRDTGN